MKLMEAPRNLEPDARLLPDGVVAIEVLVRLEHPTGRPLTDAEADALHDGCAWTDFFVAEDGGPSVVCGMFLHRDRLEAWRRSFGSRIPAERFAAKSSAYCRRMAILFGLAREADAGALVDLLNRQWTLEGAAARPIAHWMARDTQDSCVEEADETPAFWDRLASRQRIFELTELARMVNGNVDWFSKLANPQPPPPAPRFLVEGLVPIGTVTLLAAARKVGKSTLLTELAVTVAQRGGRWAGFNVNRDACRGFAVFLAGEDTDEVHARIAAMDPLGRPVRLIIPPRDGRSLPDVLADLAGLEVSLLIVDPARAWMGGDEDSSEAGDVFFRQIETCAQSKGCAAVVSQHLKKDAAPRSINEIPGAVRGTGVFLDRPRVILGMARSGEHTLLGIPPSPAGDPLHNFRQSIMFAGQRRLIRDEATMRHIPADQGTAADEATREAVLAAIVRLNVENRPVARTGKSGIFEIGAEELAKFSRQKIRAATDALIDAGKLLDNSGELFVAANRSP